MIKYKLLTQDMKSQSGNCQKWQIGKRKSAKGPIKLCYNGFHVYDDPRLAAILNSIHGNLRNPKLFEAEVSGSFKSDQTKSAYRHCTLVKELQIPVISGIKWVEFAIKCGKKVYKDEKWNKWANNWLNNVDRSANANAAADAAYAAYAAAAADAAAHAATNAAATNAAATNAAAAAHAATNAAAAAHAATNAAAAATNAAAAYAAAHAAAHAAYAADAAGKKLNFIEVLESL